MQSHRRLQGEDNKSCNAKELHSRDVNIDSKHNFDWRSLVPHHSKQRHHQHHTGLPRALSGYAVGIVVSTVHS